MNDRRSLNPRSVAHWCAALGICATALGTWAADDVAIPPDALNDRPVASDPAGGGSGRRCDDHGLHARQRR